MDGRHGTVNSGRAPADQRGPLAALVGQIVALVLAAAVLIYFAVTYERGRESFVALAVVVSLAAVFLGVRFRPEKEVQYRDSFTS